MASTQYTKRDFISLWLLYIISNKYKKPVIPDKVSSDPIIFLLIILQQALMLVNCKGCLFLAVTFVQYSCLIV